jgi:hypothetical protein
MDTGPLGYKELLGAGPSRARVGKAPTVHVISMLFFLVPSPFTSPGLDSGAGIQTHEAEVQFVSGLGTASNLPPFCLTCHLYVLASLSNSFSHVHEKS